MSTQTYEAEELSVTFNDIQGPLSQPVLEDRVEEITQHALRFREAFREYDASDINSDTVTIPIPDDTMGQPKIVAEGAEFPRDQEDYSSKNLTFDKFGFEIPVTMEAQRDSKIDLIQDQVERQARQMREDINERVFNEINNALTSSERVEDNSGTMEFSDILQARRELLTDSYNPDLLIADVQAVHDLLGSNNFLEASDMQAEMRRSGQVGQIAGMDIVQDDSGLDLTGSGDPHGLMVDTDLFGWEGQREPVTSEEYEEQRTQTDVFRLWSEMGWVITDANAARIIEG